MAGSDIGSPSQGTGQEQGSAIEQAKSEAGRLTQAARGRTLSYIEERKALLADNVGGMADAARNAAQQFDEHGNAVMADYIHRAADGLERFSDAVRSRDVSSLMGEAEDFARRQPAVFIGAGVAVGFLLARFLKSSSERREAGRSGFEGDSDYASGSGSERSVGRRGYQEGMTASSDRTWSQSGASETPAGRMSGSEGQARQELREGFTGASRPGGSVGSTGSSSGTSSARKEGRNAPGT